MTALADALDTIDTMAATEDRAGRLAPMARGLMRGYDARYRDQDWRAERIEEEFVNDIYNLDGKRTTTSRTFKAAGRKDVIVVNAQGRWVMDHKTTSEDIESGESTYWRSLQVAGQESMYLLAERLAGRDVIGAIWDVIRKPGIRPRKLTKKELAEVASLNRYFRHQVSDDAKQYAIANGRENGELYEYRLAVECTEHGGKYFQRHPIFRLDAELEEFVGDLWGWTQEIIAARRTGRHPKSPGACIAYGSPCEYLGICAGHDNPHSENWQPRERVHGELDQYEGDGRDLLTHSRLRCFQECRRKHYYRYELGIERVREEESEALYFGSLFHRALEAWWSHYLIEEQTP